MKSICAVEGVKAWGTKEGKFGLTLIEAEGSAAAVFTTNLLKAPPVKLMEERIKRGTLGAVVVNSGCANAYTGKRGYEDTLTMTDYAAESLHIDPDSVGIGSTGVIGRYLDIPLIKCQCDTIAPLINRSEQAEELAAKSIMTTDTFAKHALVRKEDFCVAGIAKGSGMIAPDMATMLSFIYTDAEVSPQFLKSALRSASDRTFNRITVDGDTSTNDIAICTATGAAGKKDQNKFQKALEECCRSLAIQIAMDGEGATKLIEINVSGASSETSAAKVAKTIAESPLVKTAVYGEDPNWGRIMAAAGRAGILFDPEKVSLKIGEGDAVFELVREGEIVVDLNQAKSAMAGKKVVFSLELTEGNSCATAWGCDLTEKYVEINGRYTT